MYDAQSLMDEGSASYLFQRTLRQRITVMRALCSHCFVHSIGVRLSAYFRACRKSRQLASKNALLELQDSHFKEKAAEAAVRVILFTTLTCDCLKACKQLTNHLV